MMTVRWTSVMFLITVQKDPILLIPLRRKVSGWVDREGTGVEEGSSVEFAQ